MAYLTLKRGNDVINEVPVNNLPFKIGRLPVNDLLLPDPSVSREHAVIYKHDNDYFLRDLESTNGTYINGTRIVKESRLNENDMVEIGDYSCIFHRGVMTLQRSKSGAYFFAPVEILQERLFIHQPNKLTPNKLSMYFYILHQLGKALLSTTDVHGIYDTALTMLLQAIDVERGVIMMLDDKDELHISLIRCHTSEKLKSLPEVIKEIAHDSIRKMVTIITTSPDSNRQIICSPLWEKSKTHGVIYLDCDSKRYSFTEEDSELLAAVANMIAIALKQSELNEKITREAIFRSNLERFLSPDVAKVILKNSSDKKRIGLGVEEGYGTIMFIDIKDFTSLSERLPHNFLTEILNHYLNTCTSIIFKHKGSVNKFIGDGVMALFGLPYPIENDAMSAVQCAIEIMKLIKDFNLKISEEKRFYIKIGINSGSVIAGNVGSEERMEYTVMGDVVNTAARLEGIAKPGQILIGEETYEKIKYNFTAKDAGTIWLKGKDRAVRVYELSF